MMRGLQVALAVGTLSSVSLSAATVVPMTFEQLVEEASVVVLARVAEVRGQWTADRRSIDSVMTLETLRYFKGDWGATVMIRTPGGEAGGRMHVIPGAPVFREGDLVVLFLAGRGPAIPTPVGLGQGVFRVVRDSRTGEGRVSPPPLRASEGGRVLRGAPGRPLLSIEAFDAVISSYRNP
ncbi:MAG: hypothetical protein ACT4QD_20670 [Acidobacteriota bacterium]